MTEPATDATWRNRYILMSLVQVGGVAVVILGLLIGRPGVLVTEAMPIAGLALSVVGLVIAFFGPKRLARRWRTPPQP